MVVKGLLKYCENIPGAIYSANLKELIQKELESGENNPTIIIDTSSFNRRDNYLRPRYCKLEVEKFVENILSCNANIIVVERGNIDDVRFWTRQKWNEIEHNFEKNNSAYYLVDISVYCAKNAFASISRENYKVFTSSDEVDRDVAEIAVKQKALAVLGQDSNYLIYEGIRYFILMNSLDKETLDCSMCDRIALCQHLNLKSYQLPLFATLCGNNVVPHYFLYKFHSKLLNSSKDKFCGIADIVRHTSDNPYNHVKEIKRLIRSPAVNVNMLIKSLDMYLNRGKKEFRKSRLEMLVYKKKKNNQISGTLYKILLFKYFLINMCNVESVVNLLEVRRPLHQKIYGILFYEETEPIVYEYCLSKMLRMPHEKRFPDIVHAQKPKCEHPGLLQLWSEEKSSFVKWELFCSAFDGSLNYNTIKCIPEKLIFSVLALHYLDFHVPLHLQKEVFQENYELEAFLVAALLNGENHYEDLLESIEVNDYDAQLKYLMECYKEVIFVLFLLNEACGLVISMSNSCFCQFFDAVLIHFVLEKMRKGANWEEFFDFRPSLKVTFCELIKIIRNKTDFEIKTKFLSRITLS